MPYFLMLTLSDGTTSSLGPIACDNPNSPHQQEDMSILRKATMVANKISKMVDVQDCYVDHIAPHSGKQVVNDLSTTTGKQYD